MTSLSGTSTGTVWRPSRRNATHVCASLRKSRMSRWTTGAAQRYITSQKASNGDSAARGKRENDTRESSALGSATALDAARSWLVW